VRSDARRVVTITPMRGVGAGHLTALSHNLATVHGVLAFHGYDPLVGGTPPNRVLYGRVIDDPLATFLLGVPRVSLPRSDDALAALRAWGVSWIVVHRRAFEPSLGENPLMHWLEALDRPGRAQRDHLIAASTEVSTVGDVTLRALADSAPIAFSGAAPSRPLPLRFDARGVSVDVSAVHDDRVTVAVLWRRHMVAYIDERRVEASADPWGRACVHTARGRRLRLSYEPPWCAGLVVGVVFGVASTLVLMALRRRAQARAV
jgi:hypothetical protein